MEILLYEKFSVKFQERLIQKLWGNGLKTRIIPELFFDKDKKRIGYVVEPLKGYNKFTIFMDEAYAAYDGRLEPLVEKYYQKAKNELEKPLAKAI